jgi:hypothetical protein
LFYGRTRASPYLIKSYFKFIHSAPIYYVLNNSLLFSNNKAETKS